MNRLFATTLLVLTGGGLSMAETDVGRYLKPASFNARVGDKVKLAVYAGDITAAAVAAPWPGQSVEWLFVRVAGTQHNMHGVELKPARAGAQFFELALDHAGSTMIGMDQRSPARLLTAAEVNLLLSRTPDSGPASRPAANKATRARHVNSSKIILNVVVADTGLGAPGSADEARRGHSAVPQSKSGQIAEIRLMADPARTPVGSALPLRAYLHGSSRAGAIVRATNLNSGNTIELRTNEAGMATLNVSATGVWMLDTWHVDRAGADSDAHWTTYRSTFTFEIPAGANHGN